jgi:hypothetical protein
MSDRLPLMKAKDISKVLEKLGFSLRDVPVKANQKLNLTMLCRVIVMCTFRRNI